jgi:hypothetical protein
MLGSGLLFFPAPVLGQRPFSHIHCLAPYKVDCCSLRGTKAAATHCPSSLQKDGRMRRWVFAVAMFSGLSSQAIAEEQPKTRLLARASCTVVRYYVAKYTLPAAEAWARSKGATEAEIETARHCVKVQTAQGPS